MPGIMSQATARPSHGDTSGVRTVLSLLCILALSEVAAGHKLPASMESAVHSSSSFSRQLVQEQVNLLPILALRSLPASSGYAKLEGPLSFREQGDILLLNQVLLWMITV